MIVQLKTWQENPLSRSWEAIRRKDKQKKIIAINQTTQNNNQQWNSVAAISNMKNSKQKNGGSPSYNFIIISPVHTKNVLDYIQTNKNKNTNIQTLKKFASQLHKIA